MPEVPASWPVVFIARHAEARFSSVPAPASAEEGEARGPGLTREGERQAAALALTLLGAGIEAVFSSDARRAEQTATIVAERLRLPLALSPALREDQSAERVLEYVRGRLRNGAGRSLLMVTHAPAMQELLAQLEQARGAFDNTGYLSLRLSPDASQVVLSHVVGFRRL